MNDVIPYDAMVSAIVVAHKVDDLKDMRDKALAIEQYSRRAKNYDNERRATEIRLHAERRAGELLKEMDKAKNQHEASRSNGSTGSKTLAELGISKQQSSDWQKMASLPKEAFDKALASDDKPTTRAMVGKAREMTELAPEALKELNALIARVKDDIKKHQMALDKVQATMVESGKSLIALQRAFLEQEGSTEAEYWEWYQGRFHCEKRSAERRMKEAEGL